MVSSGTYNFSLVNSSIVLEAFDRCGIRPAAITREQLSSAYRSLNLELSQWSNSPINLWKIELVTVTLVQGTANYPLDASVQMIADAYVSLVQNGQDPIDRILMPISRDEFSSYPQKNIQGPQTVFWFDRTITPSVTLWPVPDGETETYLKLYVMKRVQDANISGSETPDIPYRFMEALCARMAARLAVKYAKGELAVLQALADKAFAEAHVEDRERAPLYITPDFGPWQV